MQKYELKKQELKLFEKEQPIHQPRKRVDIVSIKLVKESSLLYKGRTIRSPEDGFELAKQYLRDVDREHFVVVHFKKSIQYSKPVLIYWKL